MMSKMSKMYPLEWLDSLIINTFNAQPDSISSISEHDTEILCENVIAEAHKIKTQIKLDVFEMRSKREIRLVVRKYHSSFVFLLDCTMESRKNENFSHSNFVRIFDLLVSTLDDLLSFVEIRFANYMSLDQRIPVTYLNMWKMEFETALESMLKKKRFEDKQNNEFERILGMLLLHMQGSNMAKCTYRHVLYQRELLKELEGFTFDATEVGSFSALDLMLIRLNFNCKEYTDYLIGKITSYVQSYESLSEKFEKVLFCYTKLAQINSNIKITFIPARENLITFLEIWFANELRYLEKKIDLLIREQNNFTDISNIWRADESSKLECVLSADQIGLILRATDESRIVKAKSMSYFFKSIVPYLSTPAKKDLSYQSVRSKSYNAEERDKEIAIHSLEKIIRKIKTY
ncbi:hypothetical protein [Flavobacterium luteolum]|uniref:hypothetical protein n=1 Tax=Flavobacterium luteolum TaxID=3003259 RepID=UPI00248E7C91|nr:hypothetical protein [Flavobacterium luteolum]